MRPPNAGLKALAWGLLSFLGFGFSLSVLGWLFGSLESTLGLPHSLMLGLWAVSWVLASGGLALLIGRRVLGTRLLIPLVGWVILAVGAVVSGAQSVVLAEWAAGRFGYYDPEYVGPTVLLFGIVAGVAVGGFGVQVGPRWALAAPLSATFGGVALAALITILNLPGLANGLAPDSWALAVTIVASAVYIGAVGIVSVPRDEPPA